ncbi:MAG: NADP-dependent oxidoreductase [Gammaproteobacteria bacterium]|nr:NADP-dependent oxidoreductase [Gammaproteobacteria bacterium]|tara:strand:- start:3726 stop:4733 length:1008 start_codon:yes stop_codon:yes gene_type:complete
MAEVNRQFLLAARPQGMVKESDFQYHEAPVPEPDDGQVLIRTRYISLDPSMRGQMENRADYVAPLEIGDVMRAGAVGEVVRSRHPGIAEGTLVTGALGMQDYALSDGRQPPLRRFPADVDPTQALGVLGNTGMTAYFGLLELGRPRFGDTMVVSGAAGATGSIAGQIARIHGCRVIGIAGSAEKCRWLTDELRFDAAIDYRSDDVGAALDTHCPDGIDIYFDNVGGDILDLCLERIATSARVVVCGGISRYNATGPLPGPKNYFNLVFRRARMEGFIVLDYAPRFDEATRQMRAWIEAGRLTQQATVVDGFAELPRALIRLFEGFNTGKLMVRND